MKRIISTALCVIMLVSLFAVTATAENGIWVELVDFVGYVNTSKTNNIKVKLTNNTDKSSETQLKLEIINQSGAAVFEASKTVTVGTDSVLYDNLSYSLEERGEYTAVISAVVDGAAKYQYTEYIFADAEKGLNKDIGVCTHFDRSMYYDIADMTAVKNAGFSMIRDECRWKDVETVKGKYKIPGHIIEYLDEAEKNGIEVLMMLSFNNLLYSDVNAECDIPVTAENIAAFGEYVRFVVRELKDRVRYFSVWNEPNHDNFNKNNATPAQYVKLLETAYGIIKYEYPEAVVVSGGIAGSSGAADYIKEMVAAGALNYLDVFGTHPYCTRGAIVDERDKITYSSDIDFLINDCGITKPIWILEVGYTTQYSDETDKQYYNEEEKGAYDVRTVMEFLADGRVEKMLLYQFKNPESTDDNEQYGLMNHDGTAGPGYKMINAMSGRIFNADFAEKWTSSDYYSVYRFCDKSTGDDIFVAWTKGGRKLSLKAANTASVPGCSFEYNILSSSVLKLDLGTANAESKLYKYDAYGEKTEITPGLKYEIDFKPTYIVCEKPKKEPECNVTVTDGILSGKGFAGEAAEYITVRIDGRFAKRTVYLKQLEVKADGSFAFDFAIPRDDVYDVYVYNGEINRDKINSGSVDASVSLTADGEPLKNMGQVKENSTVTAEAQFESMNADLGELMLVCAVYTQDNQLLFAKTDTKAAAYGGTEKMSFELEAKDTEKWGEIKAFLWEKETLNAMTEKTEIKE